MKTLLAVAITLLACMGTSQACAQEGQPKGDPTLERLNSRLADLEKRVAELESQISALTSHTPATTQPAIGGVSKGDAKAAPLILDDWDFSSAESDFGQKYYNITLNLRNAGTKQIKLIDASVEFKDLLDDDLYNIKISPDVTIEPGKTHVDKGQYGINQFIHSQGRMRGMKKADIKVTLVVRRVVFSDNTVLEVGR